MDDDEAEGVGHLQGACATCLGENITDQEADKRGHRLRRQRFLVENLIVAVPETQTLGLVRFRLLGGL